MSPSLIPRLPNSTVAYRKAANGVAHPVKLTVKSQIAPIQPNRQAGSADAARGPAATRIAERRRRVAAKMDKRPAIVKKTSSKPIKPLPPRTAHAARPATLERKQGWGLSERKYGWLFVPVRSEYRKDPKLSWNYTQSDYRMCHVNSLCQISDAVWNADSRIPSKATSKGPRKQFSVTLGSGSFELEPKTRRPRGDGEYTRKTHPTEWRTTPAEGEVDVVPRRPRKVKFAAPHVANVRQFKREQIIGIQPIPWMDTPKGCLGKATLPLDKAVDQVIASSEDGMDLTDQINVAYLEYGKGDPELADSLKDIHLDEEDCDMF